MVDFHEQNAIRVKGGDSGVCSPGIGIYEQNFRAAARQQEYEKLFPLRIVRDERDLRAC